MYVIQLSRVALVFGYLLLAIAHTIELIIKK